MEAVALTILVVGFLFVLLVVSAGGARQTLADREEDEVAQEAMRETIAREARAREQAAAERQNFLSRAIIAIVLEHLPTLRTKRLQSLTHDAYGNVFDEAWVKEVIYFHDNVVFPRMRGLLLPSDQPLRTLTYASIETLLENSDAENVGVAEELGIALPRGVLPRTPLLFEAECAEAARRCGWKSRTTKGSGDQGVDVIAERDGRRVVFQCKLQSSPVGNAAVQQIAAGKQFEQAHFAAVVSNATYTPAARQLANATGVALLHESEIESYLGGLAVLST